MSKEGDNFEEKLNVETLIIGAGPAGLACAVELSKKDKDFIVLEKDFVPGGLSKTYKFAEDDGNIFFTDNGPHRFFSKNPYLYDFIEDVIDGDWIKVKRFTRQYIDGKFYDYPIHAIQALRNIGFFKSSLMLFDYFLAKIKFDVFRFPILNFRDYVEANFGKRLGNFNMINYTEKIWGISADQIHQDWAGQRIKGLNLKSVVFDTFKKFSIKKKPESASLIHEFYYPRFGSGQIYETISNKLSKKGYNLFYESSIKKIIRKDNGFETYFQKDGKNFMVESKFLVESVPVLEFLQLIEPSPPSEILNNAKKLSYRSQVYLFITINKENLTRDQWIYFPSKSISFARVSEMKNFSEILSPKGKTSLFVEFFCAENDELWNMSKEDLLEKFLLDSKGLDLFTKEDIRNVYLLKQKNIYPVYDLDYEKNASKVKKYLDSSNNLFTIGRPGRFRYNNQDHSLEMGIMAAKSIIDNKRYDIESIGSEKEYYEKIK